MKIEDVPCTHRVRFQNPTKDIVRATLLHSNPRYILNHTHGGDNGEPPNIEIVVAWRPGESIDIPDFFAKAIHHVRNGVLRGGLAPQLRLTHVDGKACDEPYDRPTEPDALPPLLRARSARKIEN